MKHVSAIRKLVDHGDSDAAFEALENLLTLGPNNLEALKLQALLYASEGRFTEEGKVWEKVLDVDNEDQDAINYVFRQQTEDREHYYFTDDLPGGGRRYMAYPRALVTNSLVGLFGCIAFLTLSRLTEQYPILSEPKVMMGTFVLLVILPWAGILFTYFKSIKSISTTPLGIEIVTRFRVLHHKWSDLERVSLAHKIHADRSELALVIIPRDNAKRTLMIDMNEHTSSIRARAHLIREIAQYSKSLTYNSFDELNLNDRELAKF